MFFHKKKNDAVSKITLPEPEHHHKYRDYSWYIEAHYDPDYMTYEIDIIEPYVCIYCGHRKNVILTHIKQPGNLEKMLDAISSIMEKYPDKIEPKPIVEDCINDDIYVDREYLAIADKWIKGVQNDRQRIPATSEANNQVRFYT